MKFTDEGNRKIIQFEDSDTNSEKRIVEQGLAFIRNLLTHIREMSK